MAIETAIALPVLALLGLGSFQTSKLVVRQHELQAAAAEAEQIVLATKIDTTTQLDTIKSILRTSTGITTNTSAHGVTVEFKYRCGTTTTMTNTEGTCGSNPEWIYVHILLTDTFVPTWTHYGVGQNITLTVDRTVQVS